MSTLRPIRRFAKSTQGSLMTFWALTFAIFLGLLALVVDFGRMASTQSELQSFVDNVALAAAAELDGGADALDRARSAAAAQISDFQSFGSGGQELAGEADYALTFLASLPADDAAEPTDVTTDPEAARFVRVVAAPRSVPAVFHAAFAAVTGETAAPDVVGAEAVAGFSEFACDITPMMFCLPSPDYRADAHVGEAIRLRSGGSGAAWGPGDFGFLDPSNMEIDPDGTCGGLSGAQLDACLLGAVSHVSQCFSRRGVDLEPGQKVGLRNSVFNVRFDMYNAVMNGKRNDPDYAPAPNVIKGIVPSGGGSCVGNNEDVSPDTAALPTDDCFAGPTPSCSRFGDGNWSSGRAAYVAANYDGLDPHPGAATRWDYYRAEILAAGGGAATGAILPAGKAETGRPQCSPHQSPDPERRLITAAAIDCDANAIAGSAANVPVVEFVKLFLISPVADDGATPPTLDMWVEVVGSAGGHGAGLADIYRDFIQLYR